MRSGGKNIRSHNKAYWETILEKMDSNDPNYDDELIVIPTPVNFCIENEAPSKPTNGAVTISIDGNSILLITGGLVVERTGRLRSELQISDVL